ncbi:MAG: hypothetical protein ABFD89_29825 [Bryobacteraceae bacterium]
MDVVLENEHQQPIKKSAVNFVDVLLYMEERDKDKSLKTLWTIDPYGYTVFNQYQTTALIAELEILAGKAPEIRDKLTQVINLAKEVTAHRYLRFIGD